MSILVSINCITYNHENYIADAIEGFLIQKTDFNFEILIGEDCSTDTTRKIIEDYKSKYPELIRLITSERNVGAAQNAYRLLKQSKGDYIAICEGDDYWTDPYKLQKQVNYMLSNPDCTLCFHNGKVLRENDNQLDRNVVPWLKINGKYYFGENRKYTAGELALLGYIPTASFLFPKHLLNNIPEWYFTAVVGDNVIKLITASHGYAYFMDDVMCVYRFGVPASSTSRWVTQNNTIEKKVAHYKRFIDIFDNFNIYSNYAYKEEIQKAISLFELQIAATKGDFKTIMSKDYKEIIKDLGIKEKIKLYLKCFFLRLYLKLNKLKISLN